MQVLAPTPASSPAPWSQAAPVLCCPALQTVGRAHVATANYGGVMFPQMMRGEWMVDLLQRFWPSIAEFIGAKFKAKFRAREIYIDRDIDVAVTQLAKKPLPLPITSAWMNDFLAVLWPMMRAALDSKIKKHILPNLRKKLPSFLQSIDIDPCSLGNKAPKVKPPIKVFQESLSDGWMDLELDIEYEGDAQIELVYRGHRVGVKEVTFSMPLIVSFYGFQPTPLFFHGFSMYMCKPCEIGLKWGGILEFMDMHFVEDLIRKTVCDSLANMLLLPNRYAYALASPMECNIFDIIRPKPKGCLQITLLEAEGLVGNEYDMSTFYTGELSTDPFVTITIGAETWRSSTLWNDCNPKWEDSENTHLYIVDIPHAQQVQIHVYDDGFVQKLRAKANVGSAECDEIARNLNISVLELLGRPAWDPLQEEILVEKWIKLDSWWHGRGMGPDIEEQGLDASDEKAQDTGYFSKVLSWAKEKLKNRMERHDSELRDRLQQASARVRLRAHWRHCGSGTPLGTLAPARPEGLAGASPMAATPAAVNAAAAPAAASATLRPEAGPAPAVLQAAGVQRVTVQGFGNVTTGFAQTASNWRLSPHVQHAPAFTAVRLRTPYTNSNPPRALAPGRVPYVVTPIPRSLAPTVGPWPVAQRPQLFGQFHGHRAVHQALPVSAWRPVPQVFHRRPQVPAQQPNAAVAVMPPEDKAERGADSDSDDSTVHSDKRKCRVGSDWDRWPTYILRIGISTLEKIPCPPEDSVTKFWVTCDAAPVVTRDGKEVATSTEGVTNHSTKRRLPYKGSVAGLALTLEQSEVLARKIGILLSNGVPMECIADVLDIDEKTATKLLGIAMTEKSGCRDVIFNEAFVLFLRDPKHAELNLEVFSQANKDEPSSLGSARLDIQQVLQSENLLLEARRLPLDGAIAARIDVQCQLWPVMQSGVPVSTLIERATVAERLAQEAQGRGVKMKVWVYWARDLRNADLFGGKSDPYVIGSFETSGKAREVFRTQVIDNEPNPDWNYGPETVVWNGERLLRFEVYDKDLLGRGDKLGEAVLSREQCLQGLFTDLDLGDGNGTLRMKVAPVDHDGRPMEVPYSLPAGKPKLKVWIVGAEGLRGVNFFGGKSDPYVICGLSSEKTFKTRAINNELSPRWDHGPEELTLATELELKFEVKDKDMTGSTSLGTATLTRDQCLAGFEGSLRLGKGNGSIQVKVVPVRPGSELPPVKLSVSVLNAKNLRNADLFGFGKSDPYVMCKVKGQLKFQTKVIWNETNPQWDHGPEDVDLQRERELCFEVYDKDFLRQGDLLGTVTLERETCLAGFAGELDLGPGNGTLSVQVEPATGALGGIGLSTLSSSSMAATAEKDVGDQEKRAPSWLANFMIKFLPMCGTEELGATVQSTPEKLPPSKDKREGL